MVNPPVIVTVEDVMNEPEYVKPLTKAQKARKAKNKVAKASRKKNR
jgi:hypothetical protein